jgi:hypothetical protein
MRKNSNGKDCQIIETEDSMIKIWKTLNVIKDPEIKIISNKKTFLISSFLYACNSICICEDLYTSQELGGPVKTKLSESKVTNVYKCKLQKYFFSTTLFLNL